MLVSYLEHASAGLSVKWNTFVPLKSSLRPKFCFIKAASEHLVSGSEEFRSSFKLRGCILYLRWSAFNVQQGEDKRESENVIMRNYQHYTSSQTLQKRNIHFWNLEWPKFTKLTKRWVRNEFSPGLLDQRSAVTGSAPGGCWKECKLKALLSWLHFSSLNWNNHLWYFSFSTNTEGF